MLDLESLVAACWGIRLVYHLAGLISIMPGPNEKGQRMNIDETRNMIRAARQKGKNHE